MASGGPRVRPACSHTHSSGCDGPLTASLDRLRSILGDRYRLTRELGRGGMATVYLARDLRHDRDVALKVLRPELAALLGPERFLREIDTTARLTHPAILPLFDSGNDAGFCWYTMPFFSGRTLQDRLDESGRLPLADALRIFRDVAGALDYAHRQGVIHRDLKPANILLQEDRAILADFGVALPVRAHGERLTEPGFSIGTPEYMSPEQALGSDDLDPRSDVYALGCVLYETLAGTPPFSGPTPQAIIASRLTSAVPPFPVSLNIPAPVETALVKALAREPAERHATVATFTSAIDEAAQAVGSWTPRLTRRLILATTAIAVVVAGLALLRGRHEAAVTYDSNLVAVLPARVDAPAHALDYLREGILDLATARLTGEGGPRAVDARATLAALRTAGADSAATLARRLGAGKVLDASIVGGPAKLTITATLVSYPGATRQAPVTVEGPEDSLGVLVDQVIIRLLALHAGERGSALSQVTSLPAWRAYLRGKAAYRAGQYATAHTAFDAALTADSTFMLAAIFDAVALVRSAQDPSGRFDLITRHRDLLDAETGLWLQAIAGPQYPRANSVATQVAAWDSMARRYPDRADAWFELGDMQFHAGALIDLDRPLEIAKRNLERALALDSSFALPIDHLLMTAYARRDTSQIRALMRLYEAAAGHGERTPYYRWRSGIALGDSAAVVAERAHIPDWHEQSLRFVINLPQSDGVGLGDAVLADSILSARALTEVERSDAHYNHALLYLTLGRPTAPPFDLLLAPVDNALFSDGDPAAAEPAVAAIRRAGPLRDRPARMPDWLNRWELACWDIAHGSVAAARSIPAELRAHPPRNAALSAFPDDTVIAPLLLEALIAAHDGRPEAAALAHKADSAIATGPASFITEEATLTLGNVYTILGQPAQALRALRRVQRYSSASPYAMGPLALARARAAAAAGEPQVAIEAYQLYLAYRTAPAPRLLPQRDSARAELAQLVSR